VESTVESSLTEWIGTIADWRKLARISVKLLVALLVGAVIGAQREQTGKPAGLRTHMLVALGTSAFVIAGVEYGMHEDAISRVVQGLATGIGFLGAGTILKLADQHEIKGLTTAASVWTTAAISIAVGLGQFALAILALILTWIVLTTFLKIEDRLNGASGPDR
jgi:putative Mg2+ transporter-C (MgtC) family protein